MKAEDFGINRKTGYHDRRLTGVESIFLGILWDDHVGEANAVSADVLAVRFHGDINGLEEPTNGWVHKVRHMLQYQPKELDRLKRRVRLMQNHLLDDHEGAVILSKAGPGGGYYIADADDEIDAFFGAFRKRGKTAFRKASRGNRQRFAKIMTQAVFEFDAVDGTPGETASAAYETADALLERMTRDPERYANVLHRLGVKHGRVLLDKRVVEEMRAKARELSRMVEGL